MAEATVKTAAAGRVPAHSWYALGVLTLVYVLNFLDRVLIYFMFTPIKAEMKFTDTQLGLLGATSFAIFYTLLGIPFGRLADRGSRKRLIAGGLALWSLFSGLTGFTHSFETMFLCRVMVGVGEATLGPAALSLLSDYFPARMRATVTAVYSSAIAVGSGLALALGGQFESLLGWRWAFFLLGFPGLVACALVLSLREGRRGATEREPVRYTARDWKVLFRSVPLQYHYMGYALFGLASNQLSIWGVSFFARVHGLDLKLIGLLGGLLSLAAGVPGTVLGGVLADRLRRKGKGGRMFFSAACALLSAPLWLALLFADGAATLVAASFFLLALSLMWLGAAAADVHDIAGPQLRGLGVAVYFFAVNFAAYVVGALTIGRVNDALGVATNPQAMRYGLLLCPAASLLAALLLWLGGRALQRESWK